MRVAIIPARAGSKRILRKNVRLFCGKPMIAWSINACLNSGCFDRIVVSTDDDEIADISLQYGAEVPFKRPAELADDYTTTVPVIGHAVAWLAEQGTHAEFVCCVYATAPFVRPEDIRSGLATIEAGDYDYVFSATLHAAPIQRAFRLLKSGRVEMFRPEFYNSRSQDLEPSYYDAGQFYWGRAEAWTSGKIFFDRRSGIIQLPRYRVQDIDDEADWSHAELIAQSLCHDPSR